MITELFVENYQVDITSDIDAMMTFAIDDIKDFSARNTTFSKTIVIPGTANNNKVFGNVFDPNQSRYSDPNATNINYNFDISRSASCILFQGNMQVFKGIIRILQIVIDRDQISYECSLFGELGGLILALGTKKLEELDFSLYDIVYQLPTITNSWDPANQSYNIDSGPFNIDFVNYTLVLFNQDITAYLAIGDVLYISSTDVPTNNGTKTIASFSTNGTDTIIVFTTAFATNTNGSGTISVTGKQGLGLFFPLIDYGTYSADKINWDFRTFRPALFVYEYIKKIFEGIGYKYVAPLFELAFFKTLIIPHNQKVLTGTKTNIFKGGKTAITFLTIPGNSTAYSPIKMQYKSTSVTTSDNIIFTYNGTNSRFNLHFVETYNIQASGTTMSNGKVRVNVYRRVSGVDTLVAQSVQYNYNPLQLLYPFDFNAEFDLSTSQQFWFALEVVNQNVIVASRSIIYKSQYNQFSISIDSLTPLIQPITYGDTITINDTIPKNIMQKDFLSSIMKMFNLYLYEDRTLQKMIKIAPYVDFFDTDVNNALDWTYKMDVSKPLVLKPMSELNARYYLFKYKDDSDYYNEQYRKRFNLSYGTNRFDTGFEFAKEETSVDLIFSSTPLVGYETGGKVYPTIFKRTGDVVGAGEETMDHNIRIMQTKLITGVSSYEIKDGTSLLATKTEYPYAGHFNDPYTPTIDINYAIPSLLYYQPTNIDNITVNLFTLYWIQYMYEIIDQDSRLLIANFRLNEQDINQLDFSKLIYIQGVLYRLNKIIDYNATKRDTCKVELLKVINKNY